ncbi:hypothetical protein FRC0129_00259 [Corynebacterium diphtheriae]|nr:hypothetical protein FRC0129_00259 [Corynebacterium diphtheriae]
MSTLAALLAALGGLVTAIGSAIVAYTKQRTDIQAAKGSRIDLMEARIDKVQAQFEVEHDKRIKAETLAHRLRLGLITTMEYVDALIRWADRGSPPPPPAAPDFREIKHLLEERG